MRMDKRSKKNGNERSEHAGGIEHGPGRTAFRYRMISAAAIGLAALTFLPMALHRAGPTPVLAASKSVHYDKLRLLTRAKDWAGAQAAARKARAEFPEEPGFVRYLTWALCAGKKFQACVLETRAGLNKWPADKNLRSRLYRAHRDYGRELARRKDYAAAVEEFNKVLSLGARSAWIYKLLVNALRKDGRAEQAAAAAKGGLVKYPADKYLRVLLGRSYGSAIKAAVARNDGAVITRLLRESEEAMDHARGLHANRHLFRTITRTLVRRAKSAELQAFIRRQSLHHDQDSYLHHLAAASLRSLFNRDKRKHKALYDLAVAHRKRAHELYIKRHPNRPSPSGLEFPLRGSFMIINSFGTTYTHLGYNQYCYDLLHTGPGGVMLRPSTDGSRNEDWHGFGGEIRAVLDGTVRYVADHFVDLPPGRSRPRENNVIEIDHGNGITSVYLHNKRKSARVRRGQKVRRGQVIARVGNSGWTVSPHLHFCVYDKNRFSLPPRFPAAGVRKSADASPETLNAPFRKNWRLNWSP